MGVRYPIKAKTKQELFAQANPVAPGQPEAVPWVTFDTQLYTSAATTRLNFFQTTSADASISNLTTAGSFPDPQYFEWAYLLCDVLEDVTNTAEGVTGAWDDIQMLMLTGRPTFTFTMSDKVLGPFPASFLHASGGVTGFGVATPTAGTTTTQYGNNGIFDGGFYIGGSIIIPPKVGFNIVLNWPAAVTLTGNVNIRLSMAGVLHRRVL